MTLGLPNGPLRKVIEMMQSQADGGEDFRRNFIMFMVSTCLVETKEEKSVCYLDQVAFKLRSMPPSILDVEKEHRNKSVEAEAKVKDQIRVSKVMSTVGGSHNKVREVGSWRMPPLKRARKVVAESTSDVLIRDTLKKSKSRTWVLLQNSFDAIKKHFVSSWDMEKHALPKGVVLLDSKLDIPTLKSISTKL
ncbi:hypothetical protein Cgig2_013833 [Carnegiea gigantea]|uniref:Uncharacterized protein n=1 Tax=Carnegiea gigantea TaxID=171969 RepID=A0A9Q1Q8J8_9CARY|nr:hypothetical protein Cgig2_013833 [Carnegiea gigantea]